MTGGSHYFVRFATYVLALGVSLVVPTLGSLAQDKYPTKPVKIIVPYAPGGATDLVARVIGDELKNILGQAFVIENKPGAFGIPAIEEMARSKADGYTLMLGNVTTNAMTPVLFPKKFKIDYGKDVMAISNLVAIPVFMLVSTKDFAPRTIADLVIYAKANTGKLRYASAGVGSYPHFDMALLAKRAQIDAIHIPNKAGGIGMVKDMATGDVHVGFVSIATAVPMIKAGHIQALAIVGPSRSPDHPNIPTMAEAGFEGIGTVPWQALFAPSKTPKEIAETLNGAVRKALASASVEGVFRKQDFAITPNKDLADAQTWLASEIAAWKAINDELKLDLAE